MPINAKRGVYLPLTSTTTPSDYEVSRPKLNHISVKPGTGKVVFTIEFEVPAGEIPSSDQTADMIKKKCYGDPADPESKWSYWGYSSDSVIAGGQFLTITLSPDSTNETSDSVVNANLKFSFIQGKVNGAAGGFPPAHALSTHGAIDATDKEATFKS